MKSNVRSYWKILLVCLMVVLLVLPSCASPSAEEGLTSDLPEVSVYKMVTYDSYTVTQDEFPLYYEVYAEETLLGSVTVTDSGVTFAVDPQVLPKGQDGLKAGRNGLGSVSDRFTGYKDSLQQLHDAGYSDFFVICYENGNYFMAGVKDGAVAVLPMWERMKGMEYLYSHFMEPMPIAQAEEAMDRWDEYYFYDTFVSANPWLYPNMMFEDAPTEVWMFSPIKSAGEQAYYGPGWDE